MNGRWAIGIVVALSFAYATVRYIVLGEVPVRQFPLYVANKSTAMSSLLLLGMSLIVRSRDDRRVFGKTGFLLLVAHTAVSITIITPAYFKKYFDADGTFFAHVEAGLALGVVGIVVAAYLFFSEPNGNGSPSLRRGGGRLILVTTGVHTALLGYPTWTAVDTWPGYLPPITLLGTIAAIVMLAMRSMTSGSNTDDAPHVTSP